MGATIVNLHSLGAESSPFKAVQIYFGAAEWSEMSNYEKNSILNQYTNYQRLMSLDCAFPIKPPAFMLPKPALEKLPKHQRNTSKSKRGQSDDEWKLPEGVNINVESLEPRRYGLRSRKVDVNYCSGLDEGITGRHLSKMNDKDLSDMGIKKGSRLDILHFVSKRPANQEFPQAESRFNSGQTGDFRMDNSIQESSPSTTNEETLPSSCGVGASSQAGSHSHSSFSFNRNSYNDNGLNQTVSYGPTSSRMTPNADLSSGCGALSQASIHSQGFNSNSNPPNQSIPRGETSFRNSSHVNLFGLASLGASSQAGIHSQGSLNCNSKSNPPNHGETSVRNSSHSFGFASLGTPSQAGTHSQGSLNSNSNSNPPNQSILRGQISFRNLSHVNSFGLASLGASSQAGTHSQNSQNCNSNPPNQNISHGQTSVRSTSHVGSFGGSLGTSSQSVTQSSGPRTPLASISAPVNRTYLPPVDAANYKEALNEPLRVRQLTTDRYNNLLHAYDVREIIAGLKGGPEIIKFLDEGGFICGSKRFLVVNGLNAHLYDSAYDVREIIAGLKGGPEIIKFLDEGGFICGSKRFLVVNGLNAHLYDSVSSPNLVSTAMRESMAISFVYEWQHMSQVLCRVQDMPWHHWYHPQNMGFLAHTTATSQRNHKRTTGTGLRSSGSPKPKVPRKLVIAPSNLEPIHPDPIEHIKNVTVLKNTMPTMGEKQNIMALMKDTFERRRTQFDLREMTTANLIDKYPHFLSYGGEVIQQEFNLYYPNQGSNFLREFPTEFAPKLLSIANSNPSKYGQCRPFSNEVLNAMWVLSKFLPVPRRNFDHETRMPLHTSEMTDLIHIIPLGSDPDEEVSKRRAAIAYPLQPHIMAIGHPQCLGKLFLVVGDGKILELPRQCSAIQAVDLLLKTYHGLHLHYPLAWKNVYRFIQVHIYDIPLARNSRESKFSEKLLELKNHKL